jgi:crossover junction endodeoxyribonuclease RuvC
VTDRALTLGFDPGLATTGYGVVRASDSGWIVIDGGVITTPKGVTRPQRLLEVYNEARRLIEQYRPCGVAIEEIYFATNSRTAMLTAETRGVLLMAAYGTPVRGYTPLQVKKRITGYGKAKKQQVQQMVKELLGIAEIPRPDDVADGLALALCYLFDLQGPNREEHDYI